MKSSIYQEKFTLQPSTFFSFFFGSWQFFRCWNWRMAGFVWGKCSASNGADTCCFTLHLTLPGKFQSALLPRGGVPVDYIPSIEGGSPEVGWCLRGCSLHTALPSQRSHLNKQSCTPHTPLAHKQSFTWTIMYTSNTTCTWAAFHLNDHVHLKYHLHMSSLMMILKKYKKCSSSVWYVAWLNMSLNNI